LAWFNAEAARASRRNRERGLRILAEIRRQELQRREALQPRVLSFVNHPHPTATEFLDDAVVRQRLAEQWIVPDPETLGGVVAARPSSVLARSHADRRPAEETAGPVVGSEQRPHLLLQLLVVAAGASQKTVALRRGSIERGLQQPIDEVPAFVVHVCRAG
jgi:hypothetical protein